ncbi:MAG: neutral/alkaline non-lysosomal ceramidase N-terminal domain-containing protein [Candidatus Omnitrophica bacterium]|nr:neutral/alkaline non-lysosomal ceramidase N-terminal domain-containing protein [Candidatus Omnitrophota bacterium]
MKQLSAILLSTLLAAAATAMDLKAGAARVDLTPPLEMGATLGGYGERMSKPAVGVHDRVWAKAVVFEGEGKRFALVTLDAVGIPPAIKPAAVEKLASEGWSLEAMMILPSHSHASLELHQINPMNTFPIPQLGLYKPELYEFVVSKLAEVVRSAAKDLRPVRIGTGSKNIGEGWKRNRREGNTYIDPTLTVTRIEETSGKPVAVLVNWATHPTFMSEAEMMFSGGWPGHLQRTLEAWIGQGVTVLFFNGAEGDQSPLARPDSGPSRWERAERYGRELGFEAVKVWESISARPCDRFSFHRETIPLPKRTWHKDFMETGGTEYGMRPEIMEDLLKQLAPSETASVSLRLGDLVIVGIPGELAAGLGSELGKQVSEATDARHVLVGGLADEWISYILAPEEYDKGGYEASVSFYGRDLAPTLLSAAREGASTLK